MITYLKKCTKCKTVKEVKGSIKEPIPKLECCGMEMKNVFRNDNEVLWFSMPGIGAISQRFQ